MPLMEDLRNLFRRKRTPVEIDLAEQPAGEPRTDGAEEGRLVTVERRGRRSMSEIQQGYDEVIGLVRRVGDHLDAQTRRTEKLIELMERLPSALDALPELNRHNARLLELLNEHMDRSRGRDESLNTTLGRLSESSGQQTEVLGLLQQQMDRGGRASEQMTETLTSFSGALNDLATNNTRSSELLARLMDAAEERESRLVGAMNRTQAWMIACTILVAVGVLAIALLALLR